MSDLKATCPGCGARTSAVGRAREEWEPCPHCGLSAEAAHEQRLGDRRPPNAVMLPVNLDPGEYRGPGATSVPAQIMGLPVIWGDRVGLVYS